MLEVKYNPSVIQYLQYIKLQMENGFLINREYEALYQDYCEYCERNGLEMLGTKELAITLNKLDLPSARHNDAFTRKTVVIKDITIHNLKQAIEKAGGDMVVDNIYTILNGQQYQIVIKIIPIMIKDAKMIERQEKEERLIQTAELEKESLNLSTPEPTGEGEVINNN